MKITLIIIVALLLLAITVATALLYRKGKNNANTSFSFTHRFTGSYPYISPTDLQQRVVELVDSAEKHGVADTRISGIRVELILDK